MNIEKPAWLERLMGETFFGGCGVHQDRRKNEKNVFCLHCCLSICPHCLSSHRSHPLLQVLYSPIIITIINSLHFSLTINNYNNLFFFFNKGSIFTPSFFFYYLVIFKFQKGKWKFTSSCVCKLSLFVELCLLLTPPIVCLVIGNTWSFHLFFPSY